MHLPLVLPPVVIGYLLLISMAKRGVIGQYLWEWFHFSLSFSWKGAVLASMVMAFPLMVRSIRLAFEAVDPKLEQAARTLGAIPLKVFFTLTLPLSFQALLPVACWVLPALWGSLGQPSPLSPTFPTKPKPFLPPFSPLLKPPMAKWLPPVCAWWRF